MNQDEAILTEIESLDVNSITTHHFLVLVRQLSVPAVGQNQSRKFNKKIFKLADRKLVEFSKTHNAWLVVFSVLQNPANLSDNELFQAASILKNKIMFDFFALKQSIGEEKQQSVILQICRDLVLIIRIFSSKSFSGRRESG